MKTKERSTAKSNNFTNLGKNIIGKTGYGMKLAANLGYRAGYNMAKHPGMEKIKKQIERHPAASLMTLIGLTLGIIGAASFFALRAKA